MNRTLDTARMNLVIAQSALTAEEIARRAEISSTALSRLRSSVKRANPERVRRVAEVLGVDPDSLWIEDPPPERWTPDELDVIRTYRALPRPMKNALRAIGLILETAALGTHHGHAEAEALARAAEAVLPPQPRRGAGKHPPAGTTPGR